VKIVENFKKDKCKFALYGLLGWMLPSIIVVNLIKEESIAGLILILLLILVWVLGKNGQIIFLKKIFWGGLLLLSIFIGLTIPYLFFNIKNHDLIGFLPLLLMFFILFKYSYANYFSIAYSQPRKSYRRDTASNSSDSNILIEVEIRGESFYQENLISIFGTYTEDGIDVRSTAFLVREPSNKYDKNAIKCMIDGKLVGHVNREDAEDISSNLDSEGVNELKVECSVRGGWKRSHDHGMYGVTVFVPEKYIE
jgi:HIRAN domain